MKNLTRNQWLLAALVLALGVNACCHSRSPAYREYRAVCARLTNQQRDFYSAVERKILPAITNAAAQIAYIRASNLAAAAPRAMPAADAVEHGAGAVAQSVGPRYTRLSGVGVCEVGSDFCVCYNGRTYRLGDSFLGAPISYIDGCSFGLVDGRKFTTISSNMEGSGL